MCIEHQFFACLLDHEQVEEHLIDEDLKYYKSVKIYSKKVKQNSTMRFNILQDDISNILLKSNNIYATLENKHYFGID